MTALVGVLSSYAVDGNSDLALRRSREYVAAGVPFFWDSGAWSVHTGMIDIDIADHVEWMRERDDGNPLVRFAALDVIGNPDATLENYREQRAAGVRCEPTWHYGEPLEQVDKLIEVADTEWINIGGIVALSKQPRRTAAAIAAVRRRLPPEVKVHAFGCTNPPVAALVRIDSGDSVYWRVSVGRFLTVPLWDERRADWRRFSIANRPEHPLHSKAWREAHRHAAWLRKEYGLTPQDMIAWEDQDRVMAATMESHRRFAEWVERRHGHDCVIYLAGGVNDARSRPWLLGEWQ